MDIRHISQGGGSGDFFSSVDMSDDTQDQAYPQRVPPQGEPLPSRENLKRETMGQLYYSPLELEMLASEIEDVDTYVLGFQNTKSQYIKTRPILDMYLAAEWRPGTQVAWW